MLCPGTLLDMLQAASPRQSDEDPHTEEVTLDA